MVVLKNLVSFLLYRNSCRVYIKTIIKDMHLHFSSDDCHVQDTQSII